MAPGHGKPFIPPKDDLEILQQRLKKQQQYFHSVIADPDCNFWSESELDPLLSLSTLGEGGTSRWLSCMSEITERIP